MKLTYDELQGIIKEELGGFRALLEQEDDEPEEPEAEAEGDDTASEDAPEASAPDAGDEAESEPEEAEEEDKDEGSKVEDEPEDIEPGGSLGFELDKEINAVMTDFESDALAAAAMKQESHKYSIRRALFEVADENDIPIDIGVFAADVARLIANYQNLIDMEYVIFSKATQFLSDKYGDDAASQLEQILETEFDISFDEGSDLEKSEIPVYAAGAMNTGA